MTTVEVAAPDRISSFLSQQMSRWVDRVMTPDFRRHLRHPWVPAVNLYEDEWGCYLVAEMAGVEPEKIELVVEGRQLVLRGERASPRPAARKCGPGRGGSGLRLHLMEIDHGPFLRTLELPESVDAGAIEACCRFGFLWVKMPKRTVHPSKGRVRGP
jgi:HSP20 family protein